MIKNTGKSITKNVSDKYNQKHIIHTKQSTASSFENSPKRAIQKIGEATGYLIGNEIADKIAKVSKTSPQNSSRTVKSGTENIEIC